MRLRLVLAVVSCLLAIQQANAEGLWRELGRAALGTVRERVHSISLPAVERTTGARVGFDQKGAVVLRPEILRFYMGISSGIQTPARAAIFVYQKPLSEKVREYGVEHERPILLGPGGVVGDPRKTQRHHERIPVMAFYYKDASGGRLGEFVGLTRDFIFLAPEQQIVRPLTFGGPFGSQVLRPDGIFVQDFLGFAGVGNEPAPLADTRRLTVHFPRKAEGATTGLQVGNASNYDVAVFLNNREVVRLEPNDPTGPDFISETWVPGAGRFAYKEWQALSTLVGAVVFSVQVEYRQKLRDPNGRPILGPDGQPLYQHRLMSPPLPLSINISNLDIEGRLLIVGPPSFGVQLF